MGASCVMGPEYQRNRTIESSSYRDQIDTTSSFANLPWWELYQDTVLQNLIDEALRNNRNIEASVSRLLAGHEQIGIVRANLYPSINYGVDASGNWSLSKGELSGSGALTPAVNISYEIDLWGKLKRMNDEAMNLYFASNESYTDLMIVTIASVAEAYILMRDLDNRLLISEQTTQTWEDNLEIVSARLRAGMVSEVDLNQAKIQLSEAKVSIQTFNRLRQQTENAICTLLGVPPRDIERGLPLEDQIFPPSVPPGLPSELLDRRPDLRAKERALAAQTARIGVAEALQYPSLVLSANMAAQFADPVAGLAGIGGQLLGPIYNRGALKKNLQAEIYLTEAMAYEYEQVFLGSLREVEDALIAVETYRAEYEERQIQVVAANEAAVLTWTRYESGLNSYLEVLDLQRSQFSSQLKASETLQLHLTSIVRLYLALGGGWYVE